MKSAPTFLGVLIARILLSFTGEGRRTGLTVALLYGMTFVAGGSELFAQNAESTTLESGRHSNGQVATYKIKSTFADTETCDYKTRGIFIVWWDKRFEYSQQAGETLDTLMGIHKECVETCHMAEPPNPQAGFYYNVYLHNGRDLFKGYKWGMGQGTDQNKYPYLTIPIDYAKTGSSGLYHEGLHIFQYKATSPLYTYSGDGKWIIEASADWYAARKCPGANSFVTLGTVTANPQLPLWYTDENREAGDGHLWQRFCHLYAMSGYLYYLTEVHKVSPEVILGGFYANTKELPQEYLYHQVGGEKFAGYFADNAAHNVCGYPFFPAGVEERAAKELEQYGTPDDFHAVVRTYTNAGTGGDWIRPTKDYVTRGWSYNVYEINNSLDGTYTFQLRGDPQGSEGASAAFQVRMVVRTGQVTRVEPVKMMTATEGVGSIKVKASDAKVYLLVVATPPYFKGNQTYSYQVLISRTRP